jgi:hypothetical protein
MKYHAHPIPPAPSNLRRGPIETRDLWRPDPGYDQPGPIRRGELSWQRVAEAFVVFVAIVMFCFLASLVEVR